MSGLTQKVMAIIAALVVMAPVFAAEYECDLLGIQSQNDIVQVQFQKVGTTTSKWYVLGNQTDADVKTKLTILLTAKSSGAGKIWIVDTDWDSYVSSPRTRLMYVKYLYQ